MTVVVRLPYRRFHRGIALPNHFFIHGACMEEYWHGVWLASVVQESQSTQLLKQQQKMRVMDDALEYMKREYRARMEVR